MDEETSAKPDLTSDLTSEIKALIKSGDIELTLVRAKFKRLEGRDTTLDDDKLIEALAATDDDDEEWFRLNVLGIEAGTGPVEQP